MCADQCTDGATQCSGSGVQTCAVQPSGCTDWGTAVACGVHQDCSGGACVTVCADQCALGAQQCGGVGLQTCVTGSLGCAGWDAGTACGALNVCDPMAPACVPDPLPPRLVAPLGGALVSGGLVLKWVTDPTSSESVADVCSDQACANVVAQVNGASGATLFTPLSRGVYFVRARGRRARPDMTFLDGSTWTFTRAVFVTGRPVVSPALLGIMPDLDADGIPEKIIANTFPPTSASATIQVLWGKGGSTTLNSPGDSTFGSVVQDASDIDGDGRPELVTVSSTSADPTTILRYGVSGGLVPLQTVSVPGPFHSLVPAGDVDGDGYADVLAVRHLPKVWLDAYTAVESGVEVRILFGGPLGFSSTRTTTFQYLIPTALLSYSTQVTVRGVGDMDGDGLADVAFGISAPTPNCVDPPGGPPPTNPGYVDVMRGDPTSPLTQPLVRLTGIGAVTPLADVDGDGLPDVGTVIPPRLYHETLTAGAKCASYTVHYLDGSLTAFYGGTATPLRTSSWTLPQYTAPACQNDWNYTTTFEITGYLVGGGDLDGDGFDDVALATPSLYDVGGGYCAAYPGQVRLLYGSATGLLSPPAQTVAGPDGDDRLFGRSAAIVGNVTGDGADDLLVGASDWHDPTRTQNTVAKVRLLSGPRGGMTTVQTYTSGQNPAYNDSYGARLVGGL